MATSRAVGYVVTASVWNAVLSRLTDDGVTFSGNVNGGTGAFSSTLAITGATTAAAITASGIITTTAGSPRGIIISRSGATDCGISIANGSRSYAVAIDSSSGVLRIQDDSDGSPRVGIDAPNNTVNLTATAGVVNSNFYKSATLQPGFLAYNSVSDTGLTVPTTVQFDTEVFDSGSNFASNTFTAPVTGIYHFAGSIYIINNAGSTKSFTITVEHSSGPTSWVVNVANLGSGEFRTLPFSIYLSMTAADTVTVKAVSGGSGPNFDILAGLATWLSGRLVA